MTFGVIVMLDKRASHGSSELLTSPRPPANGASAHPAESAPSPDPATITSAVTPGAATAASAPPPPPTPTGAPTPTGVSPRSTAGQHPAVGRRPLRRGREAGVGGPGRAKSGSKSLDIQRDLP